MDIKSQVKSQYDYTISNKGKAIGSALGIIAGVSFGLAGKKDKWSIAGFAIGGMVVGMVIGGMIDSKPKVVLKTDLSESNASGTPTAKSFGKKYDACGGCPTGTTCISGWCIKN